MVEGMKKQHNQDLKELESKLNKKEIVNHKESSDLTQKHKMKVSELLLKC